MDGQSREESYILSFGAGVNTVALMVILIDEKAPLDEVVFADTGGETPGTYDSVEVARQYLARFHIPFRVVKARPRSTDLFGTALRRRVIPSVKWRWCTRDFKVNPIHRHYQERGGHIKQYIGIAFDEIHRMKDSRDEYITNIYPLVEKRMTRQDCLDTIASAGLPIPEKSGCFFCPFNSTERWRHLLDHYPKLFDEAVTLEEQSKHFPGQRLTDQMFRKRSQITLREYREQLILGKEVDFIPDGAACGGYCMT